MVSDKFLSFFSVVTTLSTICLFLTGFEICWRIKRKGTTDGISSAPFHLGFISGSFWLQYGILKNDKTIIAVNVVSSFLYGFYIFYYYLKCYQKYQQSRLIFIEIVSIVAIYLYFTNSVEPITNAANNFGFICMIFNMVNVGAPLLALRDVYRSKSTANLPLPLCSANFFVSLEWLFYGIIIDDYHIWLTNAVNVLISIAQLIPFLLYCHEINIIANKDLSL